MPADLLRRAQSSAGLGCNTRVIGVSLSNTASKIYELGWGTSKNKVNICQFCYLDPEEQIKVSVEERAQGGKDD